MAPFMHSLTSFAKLMNKERRSAYCSYIPDLVVQTSSAGLGLHTPALLQVIMTGITGKSPSSHCKDTVSPSVVPVVDITLTLGDNTG